MQVYQIVYIYMLLLRISPVLHGAAVCTNVHPFTSWPNWPLFLPSACWLGASWGAPANHTTIEQLIHDLYEKTIIGYRCLENMVFFKMYPIWVLMLLVLLLMREPPSLWRLQGCRRRMALRKRNRTGMDHDMLPVDSTMGPWESLQKIIWQISG